MEICKQHCEIEMRHLPSISIYGYVAVDRFKCYGLHVQGYGTQIWNPNTLSSIVSEMSAFISFIYKVGVANMFLGQSICIDENNTFQLKLVF